MKKACLSGDPTLGRREREWPGELLQEEGQGWLREQGVKHGSTMRTQLPALGGAILGTAFGQEMCIWGHTQQWMASTCPRSICSRHR